MATAGHVGTQNDKMVSVATVRHHAVSRRCCQQTPAGRGFDTSMNMLDGGADHWTQASYLGGTPTTPETMSGALDRAGWSGNSVDLWCTDRPCWGRNASRHPEWSAKMPPAPLGGGSSYTTHYLKEGRNGQTVGDLENYNDIMFTREAIRVINAHDPKIPLFSYIAFQTCHDPLEAPDEYIERYPSSWREDRRWYAASEYSNGLYATLSSDADRCRQQWRRCGTIWLAT